MKKSLAPRSFSEVGFSLIEILVVVTIIGLLTTTAVVTYSVFMKQSRDAKRKADLGQISTAIEMYRSNNNTYPITIVEGATLCDPAGCPPLGSKYFEKFPSDPKSSTNKYYYLGSASDYTLAAQLEDTSSTCTSPPGGASCGTGNPCNYCMGPYGQK